MQQTKYSSTQTIKNVNYYMMLRYVFARKLWLFNIYNIYLHWPFLIERLFEELTLTKFYVYSLF